MRKILTRTVVVIAAVVLCLFSFRFQFLVNQERHKERCNHLQKLAQQVKRGENTNEALRELIKATESINHFMRCYAISTIGHIGEMDVLSEEAVPAITSFLRSADPYERDAAAHALQRMGKIAKPAKTELIHLIYGHTNESAAKYAIECLGQFNDNSNEIIEVLVHAITARDSEGKEKAEKIYFRLTGKAFK